MQNSDSYQGGTIFTIVKGVGLALAFSLLFTILFACVLKMAALPHTVIYPINQTAKALAISIGVLAFVRGKKGWLKGGGIALLFTALSYLAFSAIGGDFSLSYLLFIELVSALFIGAVCGIVAVNLRR